MAVKFTKLKCHNTRHQVLVILSSSTYLNVLSLLTDRASFPEGWTEKQVTAALYAFGRNKIC